MIRIKKTAGAIGKLQLVLLGMTIILVGPAQAFEWVPSDEEIQKYRRSWNPFSEGPLLLQSVDIHPKGQL